MAITGRFLNHTVEEYEAMKAIIEVLKAKVGKVERGGQKVKKI